MRIVSQDRRADINYENITIIVKDNYIEASTDMGFYKFGKYTTEERALEVLQEIRDMYGDFIINPIHTVTKKEEAIYNLKTEKEEIHKTVKRKSNIFFYMPKE